MMTPGMFRRSCIRLAANVRTTAGGMFRPMVSGEVGGVERGRDSERVFFRIVDAWAYAQVLRLRVLHELELAGYAVAYD